MTHVGGLAHASAPRPSIVASPEMPDQPSTLASFIDHTLLKPEAGENDIAQVCQEAKLHSFKAVCVNPCWVLSSVAELRSSGVSVCTVIGFPLGGGETKTKVFEAKQALLKGATELDMVLNIGFLRSGNYHFVANEILELAKIAHGSGALLKVILETCLLSDKQKEEACRLAVDANADFVKTSTGFSSGGATVGDVALMRSVVGNSLGVKASGGVRTLQSLREMVRAGANRIGTSSGLQILKELVSETVGKDSGTIEESLIRTGLAREY